MSGTLSKQQELVYERLQANYSELVAINRRIGDRASVIVAGGTGIATLFGAAKFLSEAVSGSAIWLVVAAVAASLVVFFLACKLWSPMDMELPGGTKIDELWDEIINEDIDTAYANVVHDLTAAIEHEAAANERRSSLFGYLVAAVWVQVTLMLLAVVIS